MILGGTALSVLVASWLQRQSVDPLYPQTLMSGGWLIAFVHSMTFTTLKGWPGRTQAVFIGLLLTVLVLLLFGGTSINAR